MAMTFKRLSNSQSKYFGLYDDFERACGLGTLPAYCLIEPRYYDSDQGDNVFEASDQHPDHNVGAGERLIRDVYTALRKNQQVWESTILLITYDEPGGLYDHVTPPATVNPDGMNAQNPGENTAPGLPPFDFTRLGIRVPAVIVSPYVEAGTIDHTVYDHTSTLATARKLFLGPGWQGTFLTLRDQAANTFEGTLTRTDPRTDTADLSAHPGLLAQAAPPKGNARKRLSTHQKALLAQAYAMEQTLPAGRRSGILPETIKTERAASRYVQRVAAELMGQDLAATGVPR
jgi:phospholipase C